MFITEQQIALYKYQCNSKYYNWIMADIVVAELQLLQHQNIMKFISCLYHKLIDIDKNIWEVRLPDNSVILIKENEQSTYIKCLQNICYDRIDDYFV